MNLHLLTEPRSMSVLKIFGYFELYVYLAHRDQSIIKVTFANEEKMFDFLIYIYMSNFIHC